MSLFTYGFYVHYCALSVLLGVNPCLLLYYYMNISIRSYYN